MRFTASFISSYEHASDDMGFIFRGDDILVLEKGGDMVVPTTADIGALEKEPGQRHYLGAFGGTACYAFEVDGDTDEPRGMKFVGIRSLLGGFDEDLIGVVSRAFQIIHWERIHKFCGRCGAANAPKEDERAKVCPACGLVIYPELSPAVIMAVTRGREILLAHARRWLSTPFYSVLAGFVEPGETFEQAVRREVMEEVGIEIRDIRYFGSQPWPFPNSIMVGFTAEYESGELRVDENELTDAGWFASDKLPNLPRKGSIAGRLIQDFVDRVA